MQKLENISEAISYLKEGEILTENGRNRFVMKDERIFCYDNGTKFSLNLKEFKEKQFLSLRRNCSDR